MLVNKKYIYESMNSSFTFPKGQIANIKGRCMSLKGDDIDTDRIIPARYLKCVSFESLGSQVFADDRYQGNGSHPFDLDKNQGSTILIVNRNFGCGSSREHAPQALMRWGIRSIIGESFAEIFFGNCLALGIPCAIGSSELIKEIQDLIEFDNSEEFIFDLKKEQLFNAKTNWDIKFQSGVQEMFLTGQWDATSTLIKNSSKLNDLMAHLPYLQNFNPVKLN